MNTDQPEAGTERMHARPPCSLGRAGSVVVGGAAWSGMKNACEKERTQRKSNGAPSPPVSRSDNASDRRIRIQNVRKMRPRSSAGVGVGAGAHDSASVTTQSHFPTSLFIASVTEFRNQMKAPSIGAEQSVKKMGTKGFNSTDEAGRIASEK
jgi:hypothetical protein